jgi:hypothetical protein
VGIEVLVGVAVFVDVGFGVSVGTGGGVAGVEQAGRIRADRTMIAAIRVKTFCIVFPPGNVVVEPIWMLNHFTINCIDECHAYHLFSSCFVFGGVKPFDFAKWFTSRSGLNHQASNDLRQKRYNT